LIPGFDGAVFSIEWKEALWARFFKAASSGPTGWPISVLRSAPLERIASTENAREQRMRRIVFSLFLFRLRLPVLFFSYSRNRDNISTRKFGVEVFTHAGVPQGAARPGPARRQRGRAGDVARAGGALGSLPQLNARPSASTPLPMPHMLPAPPKSKQPNRHPRALEGAARIYPGQERKRRWGAVAGRVGYVMFRWFKKHKD